MQTNTNNIRVSVFPELVRADMKVTQNDIDTNEVIVRVFDQSDVEIDYATITSALIIFTKPDYHVVQGNMEVRENDLYYKMGTNEIACQGTVKAQIQLVGSSGERLTIGGFSFTVQPDPVTPWTVQSSSEYSILHSLIIEAQAAINDVDALSLWENYNPTKPYIPLNKVVYNGSCYINFVACQGVLPTDASKWLKIASRGEDGADGKDGADGTDGVDGADGIDATITIGTVTTGAAGTSASVNNVGTPSNAVFNFSIPKGDKGDPFTVDASDILANKSLYDGESKGFSFLATDTGKIYFKNSNTSGDWSDPISFEGPAGPGVPQGGTTGQFLRKNSNADYETLWSDLPINNTLTSTSTTEALSAAQGKVLKDSLDAHKADNTYQTPTIVGTQIQLIKQSDTTRLFFKLDADLSGGAITISLDEGATSKPLVDIEGEPVIELDKGFVEVVENAVNFTYAPKGASLKFYEALLGENADYGGSIWALAQDADYIYCGGDTTRTVCKIRKSDMTKVSESAIYGGIIRALAQDADYIYCGGYITQNVWKIRKSDMTKVAESTNYGDSIYVLAQDADYIYCGGSGINKVWKIRKSDMTKVSESAEYSGRIMALAQDADYIYCGGSTYSYNTYPVWKIRKSDMAKVAESAEYSGSIYALAQDADYIYCGGGTYSYNTYPVWKIRKSDMTKVSESAEYSGRIEALAQDADYIYCGGDTTRTVWKIRKSNMTNVSESANYGSVIMALAQDNNYVYCNGPSSKVLKLDKWLTPYYKYKNTILIPVEV